MAQIKKNNIFLRRYRGFTMSKSIKWPIQMTQEMSSTHGKVGSHTNVGHLHDGIIHFYYYMYDQDPFYFSFLL